MPRSGERCVSIDTVTVMVGELEERELTVKDDVAGGVLEFSAF